MKEEEAVPLLPRYLHSGCVPFFRSVGVAGWCAVPATRERCDEKITTKKSKQKGLRRRTV